MQSLVTTLDKYIVIARASWTSFVAKVRVVTWETETQLEAILRVVLTAITSFVARHLFVMVVDIVELPHCVQAPEYKTDGAAAADVYAATVESNPIVLHPGDVALIPTGICLAVPAGFKLEILPRSGLAVNLIGIANAPGTVDSDYRGEVKAIVENRSDANFTIIRGDRICQIDLVPVVRMLWHRVAELSTTERGAGGFGSTGMRR